jgi:hypothetical protein
MGSPVDCDADPASARLSATMSAEVEASLKAYMPPCEDWSEVSIYKTLVDVVAKASGRIFVGPELCQDPEYLDSASNYTIDVVHAIEGIKKLRPWLKPFLAPRLPEVRRLHEREEGSKVPATDCRGEAECCKERSQLATTRRHVALDTQPKHRVQHSVAS